MNKKPMFLVLVLFISLFLTSIAYAGTWSEYAASRIFDSSFYGARGVRGDFKIPTIDAKWSSTYQDNFITFEQWIGANNTQLSSADWEWFEIGYVDGAMDPERDGISVDYRGFFKAKNINGEYWEAKLNKTATVGTRYTFTIVDYNAANLWEIYIGSTYFGSFADSVTRSYDLIVKQGYEISVDPTTTGISVGSSDITNQHYRYNDVWKPWNNISSSVQDENSTNRINAYYSPTYNKTTLTAQ